MLEPIVNPAKLKTTSAINNGVFATLHGSAINGSGSYQYHWEPADKLVNPNIRTPQTVNLFSTTLFTLQVTDDSASCTASDNVTVNIVGGALAVNAIASPGSICSGASTQLQAFGSGGAGNYTFDWTGPNGFSSTLPNPTVAPPVTSTYQVVVHDGYNSSTTSVTIIVFQLPVANAGADKSIPYGTYTFLDGSVDNGLSYYFYSWTPADKLVNANVKSPQTTYLVSTTVYSLTATDLTTNCVSNNNTTISVEVTGGPLNVNPVATPEWICKGDTTQLHASAGGGNVGFYTYNWSSTPPGFTSTEADPVVNPSVNTTYTVSENDGFDNTTGNITVQIYPDPYIRLGPPDTLVCVYDTVRLNAGNPGSSYLWSNGATTRVIRIGTTGIGHDEQTYSVEVTNEHGCKSQSSIVVIFDFDACVGIGENDFSGKIRIYPNPSNGIVTIEMDGIEGATSGTIISSYGKVMTGFTLPENATEKIIQSLDLRNLPKGIYLVRFSNPNFNHSQKLVIE